MQVELDVNCMEANFGGCVLFVFGDIATFNATILALTDFTEGLRVWFGQASVTLFCGINPLHTFLF